MQFTRIFFSQNPTRNVVFHSVFPVDPNQQNTRVTGVKVRTLFTSERIKEKLNITKASKVDWTRVEVSVGKHDLF